MKPLGHKISKSGALLFFNMVLVFVSALLVLSNIRTRNELEESRRGFYSENAYYLDNEEGTLEERTGSSICRIWIWSRTPGGFTTKRRSGNFP